MPQTFYVTQDEEILSLVGRLRSSALLENVFVVPKRALILQSVVNLRILSREAEKLGKAVVIVTQDNEGRMLAEKAGITTRAYSEETRVPERQPSVVPGQHMPAQETTVPSHRIAIGSDDFFGAGTGTSAGIAPAPSEGHREEIPVSAPTGEMKLRIRDNTPKHLPSLNSAAPLIPDRREQAPLRPMETRGEALRRHALEQTVPSNGIPRPQQAQPYPKSGEEVSGRLSRVFRNREDDPRVRVSGPRESKRPVPPASDDHVGSRARFWFLLFIIVSTLSLVGTGAFLFLPKAEIVVVPNSSSQSIEMEFEGKKDGATGEKDVPMRLIEKDLEITVSVETSGDSAGSGAKARGKITISNEFDKEPQPLVATTRFESADGKIFRLVRGVTVPGMSETNGKTEAGVIEAEVVADESGEAYDIGPSTFTVPGFKGSPKYAKFSAKSKEKMVGGSSESEAKNRAVSAADIARAKEQAEQIFRKSFDEAIRTEIGEDDRFLPSSMEVTLVGTPSHPQVGVAASSFEYVSRWTGKSFIFSENDLREKAVALIRKRTDAEDSAEVRDVSFEYGEAGADYGKGVMYIRARVTTLFVSEVDTESLRNDFLGKGADEIKEALSRHPEIKKVEVNLKPKFFSFSVPKDRSRVTVRIEEP